MIVFNWNLLYPLANKLVTLGNDDANIRTATNRYYILSYNRVRNYLINEGKLDPNLKYNVHQKVLKLLKKSDKEIDLRLYDCLNELKKGRILADYKENKRNSKFLKSKINDYKADAYKIMDILDNNED